MSAAERLTRELGGNWRGGQGLAPCPVCQPEGRRDQRALSITERDGRILAYCHKGGCDAWRALRSSSSGLSGFVSDLGGAAVSREERERRRAEERRAEERRASAAAAIFREARCAAGTPVQAYLRSRGIRGLPLGEMKATLRFHPALHHGPSGQSLPAMVARIRGADGQPRGIHRTYLRADGAGKADVAPAKMMLGPTAGGAVRIGKDMPVIALAEGIETALSIRAAARLTCWATLSATGLKGVILPPVWQVRLVVIAADNDEAGLLAAEAAAERFRAEGRHVSVIAPDTPGHDFNDVLAGAA